MKNRLPVLAAAILLAALPLTCHFTSRWSEGLADPAALKESRAAVVRNARRGLAVLRDRYGSLEPDGRWTDIDREVLRNLLAALRREREAP